MCMEQDTTFLTESILWRDPKEYDLFDDIDLTTLGQEMVDFNDQISMPKIVRKSIITFRLKESLIGIFQSEENFWMIKDLNWQFVVGKSQCKGDLDLSQQVAFLKLVLGRVSDCFALETWDILDLISKIDSLSFEIEIQSLMLNEAEQMV